MKAIDFMNNSIYDSKPGTEDDIKSHPKIVIIKEDGTVLYSDTSNDGKKINAFGEEKICDNHTDYVKVLVERFYPNNEEMVSNAKKGFLYGSIVNFLEEGDIMFNNITTYQGPRFFINGIHAQLLIPSSEITPNQIESLAKLEPYTSYFREIEVKEYEDIYLDKSRTTFESGKNAIKNYVNKKLVKYNSEIKSHVKKLSKDKIS